MKTSIERVPSMIHYAVGGVIAAFGFNLMARLLLKLGGFPATLVAALLTGLLLLIAFRWMHRRPMNWKERLRLVLCYAGILGGLYIGLFAMMMLKESPGLGGQVLFVAHYLIYPIALIICISPHWSRLFRRKKTTPAK
ncbi:hypothetical protein [Pseudomonas marincola]|uniref:hypothetical protein n=1 Tax=Pseudomonas marincola TaxID=437900 RepID=UPI0008DEB182|nr:hypothetical protein [Pseudomonas marincola]SFU09830.1 hypothetical protein SAMN05216264_111112 [Pseudomonas marincola]